MKKGRVKGGSIIPAVIDTGRRKRSSMAQPIRNMAGSPRGVIGGAAQNIIEITSDDLVQNGGNYSLKGGTPIPMQIVTGRRSKQGVAQVVYPVDALGNYDPTFAGYIHKVLTADEESGYDPSSLIQFLPQNELSGGVSIDYSGLGYDGAYGGATGPTLGQPGVPGMGMTSVYYDGVTDVNNTYSLGLSGAFNGLEGTLIQWLKVDAAAWTDGSRDFYFVITGDGNNSITGEKWTVNNQLRMTYKANSVLVTKILNTSNTNFMALTIRWSDSGNEARWFIDGTSVASNAIDTWNAIGLSATDVVIGAVNSGAGLAAKGHIGPNLLYTTALPNDAIAHVSTV